MALYGYILNDITDGNMKELAGGGRVRGVRGVACGLFFICA